MDSSGDNAARGAEAEAMDRVTEAFDSEMAGHRAVVASAPRPLPDEVEYASPLRRLAAWALEIVLFVVTLGVGWCVWAFSLGDSGLTPAKKILGLRVLVDDQSHSAGLSRMFLVRWFLGAILVPLAALLTLGVLLFMPFWTDRNQNLWDKLSSCVVVYDPDQHWDGPGKGSRAADHGGRPWRR